MSQVDSVAIRKFIHALLLKKDAHYQRIEYMHMNEQTGRCQVKWVDREGRVREDVVQYTRNV